MPSTIEGYPVRELDRTFENNRAIVSVTIPKSLKSFDLAFRGCSALANVSLPEGIEEISTNAFDGCSSLSKIILPSSIKKIELRAFAECSMLSEISLPEGIEEIPSSAFGGCSSLAKIVLPSSLKKIGSGAFAECAMLSDINIPSGLKEIEGEAFAECTALSQVNLPDGIRIGDAAFYNTAWLNNMTGDFIVVGNTLLDINIEDSHIDIPNNVREIRLNSLLDSVESVFFPESLYDMGNILFYTKNLKSITVDENNLEYSSVGGVLYNKDKTLLIYYPLNKDAKVFEADENVKMVVHWPQFNEVETFILPENFLTDFNSLIIILQNYEPLSLFDFETKQDSAPEDYWFLAFEFVRHNRMRRKSYEPYFKNLYFRGAAPSNGEGINAYLKGLDSTLNIVWGYED